MLASLSARPRTSAWPISPPAPVMRTTGLRMVIARSHCSAGSAPRASRARLHCMTCGSVLRPPHVSGSWQTQRRQIERRHPRRDTSPAIAATAGAIFSGIGLRLVVFNQPFSCFEAERVEKRAHHLALLGEVVDDEARAASASGRRSCSPGAWPGVRRRGRATNFGRNFFCWAMSMHGLHLVVGGLLVSPECAGRTEPLVGAHAPPKSGGGQRRFGHNGISILCTNRPASSLSAAVLALAGVGPRRRPADRLAGRASDQRPPLRADDELPGRRLAGPLRAGRRKKSPTSRSTPSSWPPDRPSPMSAPGSGYMTVKMAKRVGPTGKVFANDIQPQMLSMLRQRLDREKLTQRRTRARRPSTTRSFRPTPSI